MAGRERRSGAHAALVSPGSLLLLVGRVLLDVFGYCSCYELLCCVFTLHGWVCDTSFGLLLQEALSQETSLQHRQY